MSWAHLKKFRFTFASILALLFLSSTNIYALTCQQVRTLTGIYLKSHFSYDTFDDVLSERTLENFIKSFDPGKLYFYEQDVKELRKKYAKTLDDSIYKGNCDPIDTFINKYKKRFSERQKYITSVIKKTKFDFKKKEDVEFDRKKLEFAKTLEELNDRWRKRLKFQMLQFKLADLSDKKSKEKLLHRYKLIVDQQNNQTIDQIYGHFLNAFASALDPHSTYMPADQLEDFRINTKLSLEGIGAVLRSEDGFTTIQSLVPGGAAFKSKKLKVGDKIITVGQGKTGSMDDVIDMDLREVVKKIRGTKGTTVRLGIMREEGDGTAKFIVPIVREKIQLKDRQAKSKIFQVDVKTKGKNEKRKVGVINLPSFYIDFQAYHERRKDYRSSARDLNREIESMKKQKVDAIIVDLRTNGGGSLDESIRVAGLFFDKGPVVQIKAGNGESDSKDDEDGFTAYTGPLVLMTSQQSASASEILAGAIKDYERGIIVGDEHTFGKGTVQNLTDLGYKLGATKVTISKFYRPSGASTQLKGVASDVVLPSFASELDIGEKFYDYALEWDKIKAAKHEKFGLVAPHLGKLKKLSAKRVASSKDFKKIKEEIAEFKKKEREGDKVSLNIADHREDKKKDKKKEATPEEEYTDDDDNYNLEKDYYLQETLKIATDYYYLLNKKTPGKMTLPELKKDNLVAKKSGKNKKDLKPTPKKSKESKPKSK